MSLPEQQRSVDGHARQHGGPSPIQARGSTVTEVESRASARISLRPDRSAHRGLRSKHSPCLMSPEAVASPSPGREVYLLQLRQAPADSPPGQQLRSRRLRAILSQRFEDGTLVRVLASWPLADHLWNYVTTLPRRKTPLGKCARGRLGGCAGSGGSNILPDQAVHGDDPAVLRC